MTIYLRYQCLFSGLITDISRQESNICLAYIFLRVFIKIIILHRHCNKWPFDSVAGLSATELGIQNETESCCLLLLADILGLVSVYSVEILCVETCGKVSWIIKNTLLGVGMYLLCWVSIQKQFVRVCLLLNFIVWTVNNFFFLKNTPFEHTLIYKSLNWQYFFLQK